MKLREVVQFEVGYQARRPWTWVFILGLFALCLQIVTEAYIPNARSEGYAFNGPFVVASMTVLGSLFGLMLSASFAGDAAARDSMTGMYPLVYTSPVRKRTYLVGRLLAALFLGALGALAVQGALLLSTVMPDVPPEVLRPFDGATYLGAFAVIALPNAIVATVIMFAMSVLTRRAIAGYIGAVLIFFISLLSWLLVAGKFGYWSLAKLIDPLGMTVLAELSMTTTPVQKDVIQLALNASFLLNRGVWLAVAVVMLAVTHHRFRMAQPTGGGRARNRNALRTQTPAHILVPPKVTLRFGAATRVRQALAIASQSFREVAFSWGGLVLAALTTILIVAGASALNHLNVPIRPTTWQMIDFVGNTGELLWNIVPLLTAFYVGEQVWRDRETRISEIVDAAPVPDSVRYAGRFLGIVLVLVTYQVLLIAASMAIQVQLGYFRFEFGLYAGVLLGLMLVEHVLFAVLAFTVHVLVNHKYAGHMVTLLALGFTVFASAFGIQHNLLVYGRAPEWLYSDMRAFGGTVAHWLSFKLYWAGWAIALAVLTKVFWVRGREMGVRSRLRSVPRRLNGGTLAAASIALVLIVVAGGFTFYNTNVIHQYDGGEAMTERRAEYERRYGRYEGVPQPTLTAINLRIELHPSRRVAEVQGTYRLLNATDTPIDTIHVTPAWMPGGPMTFDRPARTVSEESNLAYRIYALDAPLLPGDSLQLAFSVRYSSRGFTNEGIDVQVASRATFFDLNDWLPAIGYQRGREIAGAGVRREQGLLPRAAVRSLDDEAARSDLRGTERVSFEAIVGTDSGQTAVAPGALQKRWTESGRQYFHYVSDAPIRHDLAIYSATYAVRQDRWNDVAIEVFSHPEHQWNADRMVRAVQASLEYLTREFGPYPHRTIRLVEHPGNSPSLHAYPVNVSFQEGFAVLNPDDDPRQIDFVFAIVAHEMAHHWWGHQVTPARVEGAALLSESLAWYSALSVVNEFFGQEHLDRLLGLLRAAYRNPRASAGVPLLRTSDLFDAYRKGPFAMYALREYVGAARVNLALRRLADRHRDGRPPLPTTRDLYAELQAVTPDSLRYLLSDLFEVNTYWELSTENATAEEVKDGWVVTLDAMAEKVTVDTVGTRTNVPMNDLLEVGVFGESGEVLYRGLHRIRSGLQRISIRVPSRPVRAGIDPRHLLIDVEPENNFKPVRISR